MEELEEALGDAGEDDQNEETQATAAAATVQQQLEVGKAAVSTYEWITSSALPELVAVRLNHQVGDRLLKEMVELSGVAWTTKQEARAASGRTRDYPVCCLLRGDRIAEAMRRGGRCYRRAAPLEHWQVR